MLLILSPAHSVIRLRIKYQKRQVFLLNSMFHAINWKMSLIFCPEGNRMIFDDTYFSVHFDIDSIVHILLILKNDFNNPICKRKFQNEKYLNSRHHPLFSKKKSISVVLISIWS